MSKIGKRISKNLTLAVVLSIFLSVCCGYSLVNGEETDFQKIRLTPTDVSWELDKDVKAGETKFNFELNVSIFNPNSEPFCIVYSTELVQFVNTIAEIELVNDTKATLISGGLSSCMVMDYRQINPGTTTNQSASKLHIEKEGLSDLPDGNYTFSACLFGVNKTEYTSDKLHLEIKNGIPTIHPSDSPMIYLGIQDFLFTSTIFTIFIVINFTRRKKE